MLKQLTKCLINKPQKTQGRGVSFKYRKKHDYSIWKRQQMIIIYKWQINERTDRNNKDKG